MVVEDSHRGDTRSRPNLHASYKNSHPDDTFETDPVYKSGKDNDENLWALVLSEVQTSRTSQLPASKNLLVLGDKESGKTTLIAKLQGNEDPKKGIGLEYGYITVRDEYRDDHTRLGHWILDGDYSHCHLLRFALTESNFTDTTVLLCVAMTTPWNIMDQLHNWASILQDHIDKLGLSAEKTKQLQNENIRRWQSYIEPGDDMESGSVGGGSVTSPTKRISRNLEATLDYTDDFVVPLPENTLTRNLGLDLVVVITKTDYMSDLERENDYKEEHFDFIQKWVRTFCLQFGASLFYTSVKEDKNCDLLYKYLVHRIYSFPFKTPALVVEKDAVFIPAGWDNEKKIAILHENMHSVRPDQYYTEVIFRPIVRQARTTTKELDVAVEDEQQFLLRQQGLLQEGGGSLQPTPMVNSPAIVSGVQKPPERSSPRVESPKKWRPGQNDPTKMNLGATNTSEGVLANFFNSLLCKKPGPAGFQPGQQGAQIKSLGGADDYKSVRSDAAAELDRLTRNVSQKKAGLENSISEC